MSNLINPRRLEPKYKRWNDPRPFRGHVYFAYVGRLSRKSWTRASEAEAYAKRIWERWCRLYDAAVLALALESALPRVAEEGERTVTGEA